MTLAETAQSAETVLTAWVVAARVLLMGRFGSKSCTRIQQEKHQNWQKWQQHSRKDITKWGKRKQQKMLQPRASQVVFQAEQESIRTTSQPEDVARLDQNAFLRLSAHMRPVDKPTRKQSTLRSAQSKCCCIAETPLKPKAKSAHFIDSVLARALCL